MTKFFRILLTLFFAVSGAVAFTPEAGANDADVYTTPGEFHLNGRFWRTWCEPYSQTARCRTELAVGGKWVFNNLTYLASDRALWKGNPLAANGVVGGKLQWTAPDGQTWRSECDSAASGRNGCRAYILKNGTWVFNNIVHFGTTPDLTGRYSYQADPLVDPTPKGAYVAVCSSSTDPSAPKVCRNWEGTKVIPDPRIGLNCVTKIGSQATCTNASGTPVPYPAVLDLGPRNVCSGERITWAQVGWTICQNGWSTFMMPSNGSYVQARIRTVGTSQTMEPVLQGGKTIPVMQCGKVVRAAEKDGGLAPVVDPNCQ